MGEIKRSISLSRLKINKHNFKYYLLKGIKNKTEEKLRSDFGGIEHLTTEIRAASPP